MHIVIIVVNPGIYIINVNYQLRVMASSRFVGTLSQTNTNI